MICPEMHFDTSLIKKQATSATSSGKYIRLFACQSAYKLLSPDIPTKLVAVTPGAMAFTRIPSLRTNRDNPCVKLLIATFVNP